VQSFAAKILTPFRYIEENHASKAADIKSQRDNSRNNSRRGPSQEMMQYWGTVANKIIRNASLTNKPGYKFEAVSLLRTPWAEATREEIENRDAKPVNNEAQYCSIATTGIGSTSLILGGEVDAVLGAKPDNPNDAIPWVELKTAQQPVTQKDDIKYERKLLKFWAQSFLLGVPKIVVGFRSPDGHLLKLVEHETQKIPSVVKRQGQGTWDGNTCINFAAAMLEVIKTTVQGDGVWRIQRRQKDGFVEIFQVDGVSPDSIVTPAFRAHRERLVAKEVAAMLGNPPVAATLGNP
jgi:RAT1-interacting protein